MADRKAFLGLLAIVLIGLALPHPKGNPVVGAENNSYNARSFWYYPWGRSGTHKGVDVFASIGTDVKSTTGGLVLYTGQLAMGGKVAEELTFGPDQVRALTDAWHAGLPDARISYDMVARASSSASESARAETRTGGSPSWPTPLQRAGSSLFCGDFSSRC